MGEKARGHVVPDDGYKRQDIAIASLRGRDKSVILKLDTLGDAHTLKSFTGEYDLLGDQVFREGGLLAESVYRSRASRRQR